MPLIPTITRAARATRRRVALLVAPLARRCCDLPHYVRLDAPTQTARERELLWIVRRQVEREARLVARLAQLEVRVTELEVRVDDLELETAP